MATTRRPTRPVHPLLAFLLSGAVPLFLGALLADLGYRAIYEVQWANFAAWLLVGAMVLTGLALLWTLVALIVVRPRPAWLAFCFLVLLAVFLLGLVDSFVHARDAYGVVPAGPILTAIAGLASILAAAIGLMSLRPGEAR